MENEIKITQQFIENRIFTIRGEQVMIDRDLAEMYQVKVKRLNEQVKRNIGRFPQSFRFQLNNDEKNELVAICDRFESLKYSSVNPYIFTEKVDKRTIPNKYFFKGFREKNVWIFQDELISQGSIKQVRIRRKMNRSGFPTGSNYKLNNIN